MKNVNYTFVYYHFASVTKNPNYEVILKYVI